MQESPIFERSNRAGLTSAKPLKEAFTEWPNLKRVLISLFGATAGQGVVWYTGQFYALFYLQTILKVHATSAAYIVPVGARGRHAVVRGDGRAVRSHRPQAHHDGGLSGCRRVVPADLSRHAAGRRVRGRYSRVAEASVTGAFA